MFWHQRCLTSLDAVMAKALEGHTRDGVHEDTFPPAESLWRIRFTVFPVDACRLIS